MWLITESIRTIDESGIYRITIIDWASNPQTGIAHAIKDLNTWAGDRPIWPATPLFEDDCFIIHMAHKGRLWSIEATYHTSLLDEEE